MKTAKDVADLIVLVNHRYSIHKRSGEKILHGLWKSITDGVASENPHLGISGEELRVRMNQIRSESKKITQIETPPKIEQTFEECRTPRTATRKELRHKQDVLWAKTQRSFAF